MQRLASIVYERRTDDRPALIFGGQLSYSELWIAIETAAGRLREKGVKPGSKVVLALPNSPSFAIALMALSALDAVSIPLDPWLTEQERASILDVAQPDFILAADGQQPVLGGASLSRLNGPERAVDPDLNGVSTIVFTSGTTGAPKGVMLSAAALLVNARSVVEYLQLGPHDRTLIFLPLFYSYPLSQLLTTWMAGGTVVLMKNLRFPRKAMTMVDEQGVTGIAGVPASLALLAEHANSSSRSLRYVMNAGGPLSETLAKTLTTAFPNAALLNNYGCTEIGPRATTINYLEHPDRLGSIGRSISNVCVRLIRPDLSEAEPAETAEIVLSGPTLMKGYYRDPNMTAARLSHWGFHTGDYAYADAKGFLYFQGRNDDVFKCGGEKVSAREIEDVLLEYEGVREAAVVAESDPLLGTVPVAYVVGADRPQPTAEDLQMFCRRKLSAHKLPRRIHFVPRLERTSNGKVQKFRLKDASVKGAFA